MLPFFTDSPTFAALQAASLAGVLPVGVTGGSGLTSSLTTLLFFESGWFDNVIQYEMIVSGLTLNANMSFYPRFMIEGSGSAGSITFGGGYGPIVFDCIPIDSSSIWTPPAESDDY